MTKPQPLHPVAGAMVTDTRGGVCVLRPRPHGTHPTPYTQSFDPTRYTLHPTPDAVHLTPHTSHPTPYTLSHDPACDPLPPLPNSVHAKPLTLNRAPCPRPLYPDPLTRPLMQVHVWDLSRINEVPSTLNPQPQTLNPQPQNLNPQPYTLNHQPSTLTLDPQPSTL